MKTSNAVLVVNSGFPEINQLAAELQSANLLSSYVRPYANLERGWERILARAPVFGKSYAHTFGCRVLPTPLDTRHVHEVAFGLDFTMAIHSRLSFSSEWYRGLRKKIMYHRTEAIAKAGEKALSGEQMVIASWYCALPVFEKAAQHGITRVLNYPLAHHAYTHRYLQEEAELEPSFAATLSNHNNPQWQIDRLNREIELANHILVGSSFVKDTFVAEGVPEEKLKVIPYGADTTSFQPPPAKQRGADRFDILFVGQISQRKGLSYLLRAYERIHGSGTSLTLVGRLMERDGGACLQNWRHLIRHVPQIPHGDLVTVFQQADVFVFPTLAEGMGLVVVEAMASGLPVITTPNGPGDIVRDGVDGFVVPPRDVDAIVQRLQQLRDDPDLRLRMAANARVRSQEFSWEHYQKSAASEIREWLGYGSSHRLF